MQEIIDAVLSLFGLMPNWVKIIFHAINIPFLMTIGFAIFVRYVMMPLCEKCLDCRELKKVDAVKEKSDLTERADIYNEISKKIVQKKVGPFLTGEKFAQQKQETVSSIDEFLK